MEKQKINEAFIQYASGILGDTKSGLTGSEIVNYCNKYSVDFCVDIPITSSDFGDFGSIVPNKRTALSKNLNEFNKEQQFIIIKELCELPQFKNNKAVQTLKAKLFERYPQFVDCVIAFSEYTPTGWERVDRAIKEMESRFKVADNEEKYQAIGMIGREILITVAQQVYKKDIHKSLDGIDISTTDSKRMLEAYLQYELKESSEKTRKWARSAVDLGNQLTHDRNATKRNAHLCIIAVSSVVSAIKAINDTENM